MLKSNVSFYQALLLLVAAPLLLSGCSWFEDNSDEAPLPGQRVSVLELQKTLEPTDTALKGEGFVSPDAWQNEYWPQAGGYPNHAMQHVALNSEGLKKIWSADIGQGSEDALPLTAQPVVFGNIIYALDTNANVTAFDAKNGEKLWSNSVRPAKEEDSIGGGLAVSANMLYVTNGYGEILGLNPKKGGIYWRTKLGSPTRAAPTFVNDKVYVLTLDNHITALDAVSGKKIWSYEGFSETTGLLGSSSPAADGELVIAAMSSGEVTALRSENGSVAWSDTISPSIQMGGASALPDIAGLPVLDKGMVIAASYGGKIAAIDVRSGARAWEREIGSAKTPWVAGNMIFYITSNAELVALGRDNGTLAWVKPLGQYIDDENAHNALLWNGPILAGNRLIVAASDDTVLEISPKDGALMRRLDTGSHVAVPPLVANGMLYLLGTNGTLSAWR